MTLPKLTPTMLQELAFNRFRAVYNLSGAWAIKDDPTQFTKEWLRVLEWCHPEEITRGVNLWIAGGKDKWPTPGQLYGLIVESRPAKVVSADKPWDLEACGCSPGCRWNWYDLPNGRYRLKQDCVARRDGLTLHSFAA